MLALIALAKLIQFDQVWQMVEALQTCISDKESSTTAVGRRQGYHPNIQVGRALLATMAIHIWHSRCSTLGGYQKGVI